MWEVQLVGCFYVIVVIVQGDVGVIVVQYGMYDGQFQFGVVGLFLL